MDGREALMEAGLALLLERGTGEASARDIGARAGVPVSLINYHYGGKDALLREVTIEASRRWLAPVIEGLQAPAGHAGPADVVVTGLEHFLDSLPGSSAQAGSFLEAVARARRDPLLASALSSHYDDLRAAIGRGLIATGITSDEAPALASELVALADGWMVQWLMDGRRPSPERVRLLVGRIVLASPRSYAASVSD